MYNDIIISSGRLEVINTYLNHLTDLITEGSQDCYKNDMLETTRIIYDLLNDMKGGD